VAERLEPPAATNPELTLKLIEGEAIVSALPHFSRFYPALARKKLRGLLEEMGSQGYRCALACYGENCVGIVGIWVQTKLYVGRHIEYDNVYILPEYRGQGVGRKLLAFVEAYGRQQQCVAAELTSDIDEEESRDFWESQGFEPVGLRYRKDLG